MRSTLVWASWDPVSCEKVKPRNIFPSNTKTKHKHTHQNKQIKNQAENKTLEYCYWSNKYAPHLQWNTTWKIIFVWDSVALYSSARPQPHRDPPASSTRICPVEFYSNFRKKIQIKCTPWIKFKDILLSEIIVYKGYYCMTSYQVLHQIQTYTNSF